MKALRYIAIAASFSLAAFAFAGTASAAGNVTGFAWSDSAGWISMNCNNETLPNGNGIPNTCSTVDYGVTLDPTSGAMSGYAWSTNLGWMKFDASGTTPTYIENRLGNARFPAMTTPGLKRAVGWARFCSSFNQMIMPDNCTGGNITTSTNGGWYGWVSMSGDGSAGYIRYTVTYDTGSGEFDGFAWGGGMEGVPGSEVVGWISFKGVYASKDPVPYVPIVQIDAIPTQVASNGDTSIKYYWVNADTDPNHQIASCSAFTDQGQVANWNVGTFTSTNLPRAAAQTINNVWVPGSPTFYYLDCKDRLGNHAGDPLNNPMIGCNTATPTTTANTCPRTRVDIINSSGALKLSIKDDTSPAPLGLGPVTVNLGDTVSISWKSADPISNCTGYSDLGVFNWKLATQGGTPKTPVSNTIESGVQVAADANNNYETNYYMSCIINGRLEWSNIVTAIVKNDPSSGLTLLGRPTGSGPGTGWTNVVQVNPGQTVDLKWSSASPIPWTGCVARQGTTPAAPNWAVNQSKPDITAANSYSTSEIGIMVPVDPSIYRIECTSTDGTQQSNDVIVNVNQVPSESIDLEIKLDGAADVTYSTNEYVPQGTNVTLRWTSNAQIQSGTCSGTSIPAATPEYWLRPNLANPTRTESNINLFRTVGYPTTYTITCRTSNGTQLTASAVANPLPAVTVIPTLTISGADCARTTTTNIELGWEITGLNGGTITLRNNGGQSTWSATRGVLQGMTRDGQNSVFVNVTNISGTLFELLYQDANGVSYSAQHPIELNPDCRQSPRRSWFFQFFER
jgi:hypothetical protein